MDTVLSVGLGAEPGCQAEKQVLLFTKPILLALYIEVYFNFRIFKL